MRTLFAILFICLAFTPIAIGQYNSAKDSDPEALALLQKAGENLATKNSQVTFSLKYSYPGQEGKPETGVLFQSGKMYNLQLPTYTIISDGKTRWVYLKNQNEVNLYNESNGQDWISPQDFLQMHKATDLVFVLAGTKADGGSIIEAKPLKGRFDDYAKFTIVVRNGALVSIKGIGKDGTRQEMYIGTITHPATFDNAKLFTFNKASYPGVYIEDLRLD
jgi:outer membrane lipoprotein-sorting protein